MCTVHSMLLQALNAESWIPTSEEFTSQWSDIIIIRTFRNAMDYL